MERERMPIGVFDSGVGGISVLRELIALMPNENYIFYGDSRNAPYGIKDVETVRQLTCMDAEHLLKQRVKALVVACNTATSAAIDVLRVRYKRFPVIGIEPALKPAVAVGRHPKVVVMATPMTLREEKFHHLLAQYEERAAVYPLPCPGLVEFVERGEISGERLEEFLRELFLPFSRTTIDAVVLGCTHYPFVKETIQKVVGEKTKLFDGGEGTARETRRRLLEEGLCTDSKEKGTVIFQNSLENENILKLCRQLLYNH